VIEPLATAIRALAMAGVLSADPGKPGARVSTPPGSLIREVPARH